VQYFSTGGGSLRSCTISSTASLYSFRRRIALLSPRIFSSFNSFLQAELFVQTDSLYLLLCGGIGVRGLHRRHHTTRFFPAPVPQEPFSAVSSVVLFPESFRHDAIVVFGDILVASILLHFKPSSSISPTTTDVNFVAKKSFVNSQIQISCQIRICPNARTLAYCHIVDSLKLPLSFLFFSLEWMDN
jgi:hypothetical protein